jgi:hypothetical protein
MLLEFIKNNNMKKLFIAILTCVTIFSCTKDAKSPDSPDSTSPSSLASKLAEEEAIAAVRKIVGNEGTVFVKEKFSTLQNQQSAPQNQIPAPQNQIPAPQNQQVTATDKEPRIIKTLTLEEFANLYKSIKSNTDSAFGVRIDSSYAKEDASNTNKSNSIPSNSLPSSSSNLSNGNVIKANDELADDGPGPAGLRRFTFYPLENGNSSLFANMNIAFNTNADGSINGNPSLYFSGITLFGWQTQQTSQISFNPNTSTSTFAITGVATFGIQIGGGATIGWGSNITFYVTLNMDENATKPVMIYGQN